RLLIVEAALRSERITYDLAHIGDAAAPAVLVALDRGHARFEAVTTGAIGKELPLSARVRQQLEPLLDRYVAPAHHALLQREVVGSALVGGQLRALARIGLVADRAHLQTIIAHRQILGAVAPLRVGQDANRHFHLRIARLDE